YLLNDFSNFITVYKIQNFNGTLEIDNNESNRRLYYGMVYNSIENSFPCNFDGMKQLAIRNPEIKGNVYDFSCNFGQYNCSGIECLIDYSIIPSYCVVNKTVTISNPDYYIIQFPTMKEALENCKATNPKKI